ncbi:MAG: rubrerythrin family protein [Negativicutes bacterium]|nr:rubrerythrin family protein [Negativicutes bacterium]
MNTLETLDIKTALRTTLTQKQELVRDYQTYAEQINNPEVSKMYRHFAEAEALHATQIQKALDQLH